MGWAALSAHANRVAFDRLGSVSVVAGAVSGRGFLATNSEIILGGQVEVIDYLLTAETSLFGGLTYGNSVVVDGFTYRVEHQPMRFDDGVLCRVPLVKVAAAANNITTLSGLRLATQDGRYIVATT
jgi:hypothetical protein